MSQPESQSVEQRKPHPNAGKSWGRPLTGYQDRLARIAAREAKIRAKAEQLADGLGAKLDQMSGLDQEFMLKAAALLARRFAAAEDERNAIKTARQLVGDVERRLGARSDGFATVLGDKDG